MPVFRTGGQSCAATSRSFSPSRAVLGAMLAFAAALPSQAPAGYAESFAPMNPSATCLATVGDDVVWYDGQTLFVDSPGQTSRTLMSFSAPRFGSFTQPIGGGAVVFAENSTGEFWRVPLAAGSSPQLLNSIAFAYDAVLLGPRMLLVSAKTGGFSAAANDLVALDLVTGAHSSIGLVAGASGPLALDANGNLLYANAPLNFPPPAASVSVLRWTPAQWALAISGGPMLTDANAQTVVSGLNAASDLAMDGDDDLFAVDWLSLQVLEIDDVSTGASVSTLLSFASSPLSPAGLAFTPSSTGAEFEPFAAAGGGELVVVETDYFATTRLRRLVAAPASLALAGAAAPVPPGPFGLLLQDAAPSGLAFLAVGTVATGAPLPLRLPGFEATLWWEPGLLNPVVTGFAGLDGAGSTTFGLTNPGFAGGLWIHAQVLFATADGRHLATGPLLSALLQ